MNRICYSILAAGALLSAGCNRPPAVAGAPRAVPTPHPARGAGEQAVRLYPDLAVHGSHFRLTFDELVEDARVRNPRDLAKVDWPLTYARRTAVMLGVAVHQPTTPAPEVLNPLERGAYDQRRVLNRSSSYRDRFPQYEATPRPAGY